MAEQETLCRSLTTAEATALKSHAEKIVGIQDQVRRVDAEGILAIGEELTAAHKLLAGKGRDGMFRPWVEESCGFAFRTAYRAMEAFTTFGGEKCANLAHLFDASALYVLSADSTPDEATTEAITRAEAGEKITHKLAKTIKQKFTPPEVEDPDGEDIGKIWDGWRRKIRIWADKWGTQAPLCFLDDLAAELRERKDQGNDIDRG